MKHLIGKTIKFIKVLKNREYSDEPCLQIGFTDGSEITLMAIKSGWDPDAEDEYALYITAYEPSEYAEAGISKMVPSSSEGDAI